MQAEEVGMRVDRILSADDVVVVEEQVRDERDGAVDEEQEGAEPEQRRTPRDRLSDGRQAPPMRSRMRPDFPLRIRSSASLIASSGNSSVMIPS